MSIFRELFGFGRNDQKDGKYSQSDKPPEITDHQPRNPYSRICLLTGHSDLVTILISIDHQRIFTAGQDGIGIVWDCKAKKKLHELIGHTRRISCASILEHHGASDEFSHDQEEAISKVLLTASFDNTIRLWDITLGMCIRVVTDHGKTVKCFTPSYTGKFYCTGGDALCVWDRKMQLLCHYDSITPDCIKALLPIRGEKLVAATDKSTLTVFNIFLDYSGNISVSLCAKLASHREAVTSLIRVSDSLFASSSRDGTINVWTAFQIEEFRKFNMHSVYEDKIKRILLYDVHDMIAVEERYIIAAVGSGFQIFDVIQDRCVVNQMHAQHAHLTCIALLRNGEYLATASSDCSIRLWARPLSKGGIGDDIYSHAVSPMVRLLGRRVVDGVASSVQLQLIGECMAHSRAVQQW